MPEDSEPTNQVQLYSSIKRRVQYAKIMPGQYYISATGTEMTTVLGSCVATCLFDPINKVGGLNHFMLPRDMSPATTEGAEPNKRNNRFGEYAMQRLLDELLMAGAQRHNLRAKLFGGAKVLDISSNVGELNTCFAEEYLQQNGIQLVSQDVGGNRPRKLIFEPATGRVKVQRLRNAYFEHVASKERRYLDRLSQAERNSTELPDDS